MAEAVGPSGTVLLEVLPRVRAVIANLEAHLATASGPGVRAVFTDLRDRIQAYFVSGDDDRGRTSESRFPIA